MSTAVYTIGHSTHPIERFIELLKMHSITAICDVRSAPYSRMNPQFNREPLRDTLKEAGIAYVFLGEELGARSKDLSCYRNGKVDYELLARTELFHSGLERVREGARTHRIALMCAEKDPLDCHRTILVARNLVEQERSLLRAPNSSPQFNREPLRDTLKEAGIAYVFLGEELGARSKDLSCYRNGKVDYELLARTELFHSGLERVREGARTHRIALMCAEKDPLDCHRTILVARNLVEQGVTVSHILSGGSVESHDRSVSRLMEMLRIGEIDLFRPRENAVRDAYRKRGEAIAYTEQTDQTQQSEKAH